MLNYFACPMCFNPLTENLSCSCGFVGSERNGIFSLHRNDSSWELCIQQTDAARKAAEGAKTIPIAGCVTTEEDLLVAKKVHKTLHNVFVNNIPNVIPGLFLEIGCSSNTQSGPLLEKGWWGFILDIDELAIKTFTDKVIPVIADAYYIPFLENTFDLIFDRASLHHFLDLDKVLFQINRVLKPGGYYISYGNPPCPINEVQEAKARQELFFSLYGLIETMPSEIEYKQSFIKAFGNFTITFVLDNSLMRAKKS